MHPETRLFLINKHLQENVLVKSAAKPVTKVLARRVGAGAASSGARTGAIQLARNVRPRLGQAARAGTTALALRPSGGGRGTKPPSGGGGGRGERNPNPNPAGRENLLRNVYSRRREGLLGRLKRTLKDVGMSGIDTLRRQQSGIYGDIAASGLNIGSSRRMGPEFGTTGRKARRVQGVGNIRGFVKDVFGTTSKKDAEGKTIEGSAEPGILSPVRGYFKASSKMADRAERRMGRGKGFFSRINRAPYKYGTYSKPSDSVYDPKASGTFRDPYQRERTI